MANHPEQEFSVTEGGQPSRARRYDDFHTATLPTGEPSGPSSQPEHYYDLSISGDDEPASGLEANGRAKSPTALVTATNFSDEEPLSAESLAKAEMSLLTFGDAEVFKALGGQVLRDPVTARKDQRAMVWGHVREENWRKITDAGDTEVRRRLAGGIVRKAKQDPQGMILFIDEAMKGMVSDNTWQWTPDRRRAAGSLLSTYVVTPDNVKANLIDRAAVGDSYARSLSQLDRIPMFAAADMHALGVKIAEADGFPGTGRNFMQIWHGWQEFGDEMVEPPAWWDPKLITAKVRTDADEKQLVIAEMAGTNRALTMRQLAEQTGTSAPAVGRVLNGLSQRASEILHVPKLKLKEANPGQVSQLYHTEVQRAASDPEAIRALYGDGRLIVSFLPHTARTWLGLRNMWKQIAESPAGAEVGVNAAEITPHLYLPPSERQRVLVTMTNGGLQLPQGEVAREMGMPREAIAKDIAILTASENN